MSGHFGYGQLECLSQKHLFIEQKFLKSERAKIKASVKTILSDLMSYEHYDSNEKRVSLKFREVIKKTSVIFYECSRKTCKTTKGQ